jgi:hypothetical protein
MVKKGERPNQRAQEVRLYVEGGGDAAALKTACREGFAKFLGKAGLQGHMPRIIACGGRENAYDSFCTAVANGQRAFLLVDSEAPVAPQLGAPKSEPQDRQQWLPWAHLNQRKGDEWAKPSDARDIDCHLMVQIMESWFLADSSALATFFGAGFNAKKLPNPGVAIESIAKADVYKALADATTSCKTKAAYGKGEHSFKILAVIDPDKVRAASPWAKRFVEALKTEMGVA